jgi:hypothetical protein
MPRVPRGNPRSRFGLVCLSPSAGEAIGEESQKNSSRAPTIWSSGTANIRLARFQSETGCGGSGRFW